MNQKDVNRDQLTERLNADRQIDLSPELYQELRVIAHAQLRGRRADATLNTTALVNEAYLKLGERRRLWQNRKHFFATMARIMRQVTVDLARRSSALKRNHGGLLSLDELERGQVDLGEVANLIAIDEALTKLGKLDARLEEVMELRFFAGMSVAEVAALLGRSEPTIKRASRVARAFLSSELELQP